MSNEIKKVDAVFEGGGVKGIGLVGAVAVTEEQGYQFGTVAGTSAGAIIAALIAAGYKASEMKKILDELDWNQFKDPRGIGRIPLIGPLINLSFNKGLYKGDVFEEWLRNLLLEKNVRTFKDLMVDEHNSNPMYRYKLQVVITDMSDGKLRVLPRDSEKYDIDLDTLDVARAARMSMSIPFFFEPVILPTVRNTSNYIADGGVLSNYPVWLFDSGGNPPWPTLGYKLVEPDFDTPNTIRGPISLFAALFGTMMEAHDSLYIENSSFARTIPIQTKDVGTIEFDISSEKSEKLYQRGRDAAEVFFQNWDFDEYKAKYSPTEVPPGRREGV